ncbi:MAG: hypothetical protein ACYC06_02040 [Ilumatobacteraceae bacterium]
MTDTVDNDLSPHRYTDIVHPSNPPAVPIDTSVEVWRRQMDAIATLTVQQRLEAWETLNAQLAEMEEQAVRRLHPDFDDHEVLVELIRRRYGDKLAQELQINNGSLDS